MPNYIENIKPAGGETYQIRDPEAARKNEVVDKNDLFNLIYPVGSIYLSVTDVNPANVFGGTWEQIKDRFLLSAGDTYKGGSTGGEASHTLTANEMPPHRHSTQGYYTLPPVTVGVDNSRVVQANSFIPGDPVNTEPNMHLTGLGQAHNNMPPYLAVYMWKRIE